MSGRPSVLFTTISCKQKNAAGGAYTITGKIENGSVEETIIPKAKHSTREKFQEVISK